MINAKDKTLLMVFILMIVASGADIITDLSHGTPLAHVIQESVLLCLSLLAVAMILKSFIVQRRQIEELKQSLQQSQHNVEQLNAQPYVLEARQNLRDVISRQFNDWQLTPSEQEIGWLLLKGLSLNEIALLRDTREKTVRQQASAIYKKADLAGRHSFSAWFIEDIL